MQVCGAELWPPNEFFSFSVFHIFLTLELEHKKVGPQIRILRELSSLEPAPKVLIPKSRSPNQELDVFVDNYILTYINT